MNAKKVTILIVFTILLIFSVVSRIFFNDFQEGWNAYEKKDFKTASELWLPLAEQGEHRAQFFLGFMQDMGFGVPEDDKKALKWYQLAAEQGDSRAQLFTGYIYDFGNGVPEDDQKAVKWYQLASEKGFKQAKINIYNLAKKNVPEALKILTTDAENGEVKAQYDLGVMYDTGRGVPQDHREAIKWYQLAAERENANAKVAIYSLAKKNVPEALKILTTDAENGEVKAQYDLGVMYDTGRGVPQDHREAVKWYQLAAERENANAKVAIYSLAKKNVPEALKILTTDAENGEVKAQYDLGVMYDTGRGVPQDHREAVKWYRFASERAFSQAKVKIDNLNKKNISSETIAKEYFLFGWNAFKRKDYQGAIRWFYFLTEQGNASARYNLGSSFANGLGNPQDDNEAVRTWRLAAEQGNSAALGLLGAMYLHGTGVQLDNEEAIKWFRLAAEKGIPLAIYSLGVMYGTGQRVPQDYKEAVKWYQLAAERENTNAKAAIYSLAEKNSHEALKILVNDAENGSALAQSTLSMMYHFGLGVPQDNHESFKWYRFAVERIFSQAKENIDNFNKKNIPQALKALSNDAENGDAKAQMKLGMMRLLGLVVPKDEIEATKWYRLAAEQWVGNAQSIMGLK